MLSYRLAIILLSPIIFLHLLWRSFLSKDLTYMKQRLGLGLRTLSDRCVWFHCASVGEANAAVPLIHSLHEIDPTLHFVVTTNTPTGAHIIKNQKKLYMQHLYCPIDWRTCVNRFIEAIHPSGLFIIETELWPNLIDRCHSKGISVCLISARLSRKTTETNAWMRSVYRSTLKKVDHVYTRSEEDRAAFLRLGSASTTTTTVGNLKYAQHVKQTGPQQLTGRDYVIAASTHDDEEYQIVKRWLAQGRQELLVIAPRHPDRSDTIYEQLLPQTRLLSRRTDNTGITDDTKIFILDTVGELISWYHTAKAVIIGGSFIDHGGQNIIEPAKLGKLILFGPHMENFLPESHLLLENNAAIQVRSYEELMPTLIDTLDDDATKKKYEENALRVVQPFESILADYVDIVIDQIAD